MSNYHTFGTPILFAQWAIDLLGLFPKALAGKNYLVVATDNLTRWIEVKALASITGKEVKELFL